MNVTGGHHMNDDNELGEVRESLFAEGDGLAGVHMGRPAQTVMARGQTLRLRRRLLRGLSGVAAAGTAMALALTLPGGAAAGFRQVHVNETGWSVNTGRHGAVYVMVKAVPDPRRLQSVLVEAGVVTKVRWGETCLSPVASLPSKAVVEPTYHPIPVQKTVREKGWTFTIHPARRPPHTVFVLGGWLTYKNLRPANLAWAIVPEAVPLQCSRVFVAQWACGAAERAAPSPLATPSLRVTPSPDPTPTSHATSSPASTPSPSATPSADSTPSPDATPSADSTPSPHATSSPSASPSLSRSCSASVHSAHHKNSG
jgi:hypothetical protein